MRAIKQSSRTGFTLVELALVSVILTIVVASVGLFELSNSRALGETASVANAQEQAHRALERVLRELDGASIATLVPDPTSTFGTDDIVFQRSTGVTSAGVVIWSPRTRISLAPDDHETLDGIDNNHNGLIDERKLTITYDYGTAQARTVTLAHCIPALFPGETGNGVDDNGNGVVDEKGFNVQRVGNLLTVRLAIRSRGENKNWVTWAENAALRLIN